MTDYFLVTQSGTGPARSIYHGSRPMLDGHDGARRVPGSSMVIYGPQAIPRCLAGAPIDTLMAAWRAEIRKLAANGS
jgi:hypothetical protein